MRWSLVLGLLVVATRPSHACSCVGWVDASPADGSTDVPRNAVIFATANLDFVAPTLTRSSDGTSVPLTLVASGLGSHYVLAQPDAMLDSNTTYRIDVATPSRTFSSTFTTGEATATTPPSFAGLTAIAPETMTYPIVQDGGECVDSCIGAPNGHISRIRLDYVDAPSAFAIVDVYREPAHELVVSVPAYTMSTHLLDTELCGGVTIALDVEGSYCARITAYDLAGNAAGGDVTTCAATTTCSPALSPVNNCTPSDACAAMPSSSGCSAAPGGGLLFAFGLLALRRRRVQ